MQRTYLNFLHSDTIYDIQLLKKAFSFLCICINKFYISLFVKYQIHILYIYIYIYIYIYKNLKAECEKIAKEKIPKKRCQMDNYNIGLSTQNSPCDLRKLTVILTPVKDHQLILNLTRSKIKVKFKNLINPYQI